MPALFLLCRLKESRDACALSALSINVRKKSQPVIWNVPQLPSDCCGLMAVPRGGVLVISQNLLMYYAQVGFALFAHFAGMRKATGLLQCGS